MPSTLALAVNPLTLPAFIPGVTQLYTGTTTATVTSSWPNAALSVYDPDTNTTNNGRLIHAGGASIIPRDMEVMNSTGAFQSIQNATQARTIATWATPVANTSTTITMRQQINNTDVLLSGEYAKTLTFSLSTTTP